MFDGLLWLELGLAIIRYRCSDVVVLCSDVVAIVFAVTAAVAVVVAAVASSVLMMLMLMLSMISMMDVGTDIDNDRLMLLSLLFLPLLHPQQPQ